MASILPHFVNVHRIITTNTARGIYRDNYESLNHAKMSFLRHFPEKKRTAFCTMPAAAVNTETPQSSFQMDNDIKRNTNEDVLKLACPICHTALIYPQNPLLSRKALTFRNLKCKTCDRNFDLDENSKIVDLTITGELEVDEQQAGSAIFQNPLVAYVYERGWRQGFAYAGFPGLDEEFKIAQQFLDPAKNGPLLDVSCGSGLFSRKFLKSDRFSIVIASDLSQSMLQQCKNFLEEENTSIDDSNEIMLVRADVARLPFENGQLAGVHAGAAIHCWPQPASAVAEISRVLKPGGVFVGSTFLIPEADFPLANLALEPLRQLVLKSPLDPFRWWTEEELRRLFQACGLVDFQCVRDRSFILFSSSKPL